MNIQKIKIANLKAAKYNPRKKLEKTDEAYKRIKASIEEFGCIDPIIVNSRNMTVIGGHQRLEILKDLQCEEIECVMVNLDEKREKRLNLSEEELFATGFSQSEIENLKIDFISDLLEDDYSTVNKELDKFAITFNIPKEYEERFSKYIKRNGKEFLVDILINEVERIVL